MNTSIGEGVSKEPAQSFVAAVVVSSKMDSNYSGTLNIRITEKDSKKVIGERKYRGIFFKKNEVVLPLFVYDNVCSSLIVTAKLTEKNKVIQTQDLTVPFRCGE